NHAWTRHPENLREAFAIASVPTARLTSGGSKQHLVQIRCDCPDEVYYGVCVGVNYKLPCADCTSEATWNVPPEGTRNSTWINDWPRTGHDFSHQHLGSQIGASEQPFELAMLYDIC
ncbi:MAG: hypothetical protein AB7O68_23155, partial [Pirellulales bacterium]